MGGAEGTDQPYDSAAGKQTAAHQHQTTVKQSEGDVCVYTVHQAPSDTSETNQTMRAQGIVQCDPTLNQEEIQKGRQHVRHSEYSVTVL